MHEDAGVGEVPQLQAERDVALFVVDYRRNPKRDVMTFAPTFDKNGGGFAAVVRF